MTVSTRIADDLAWVLIDNPPVNAAGQSVRAGLMAAVAQTEAAGVRAVILHCAGNTFVAGADIREFGQAPAAPILGDVVAAIEAARTPWIAAIHGTALGGGLELCLGCSHRIATADARLGLPEVTLGLIPGAGGTVRLPRLVAPEDALQMIASGRPVSAQRALEIGLIDRVATGDLAGGAQAFAAEIAGDKPRLSAMPVRPFRDATDWAALLNRTKAGAKGQNSIVAATDAVARACTLRAPEAMLAERDSFARLKADPQSAALRHVFFAERAVGRIDALRGVAPQDVNLVGVIGGGTMGAGIAAACLLSDLRVTMAERDSDALEAGMERVRGILDGASRRGKLTVAGLAEALARFDGTTRFDGLADADLVIEAVFEDMAVKRQVFADLSRHLRPDAVLATNTSYLDVGEIAQAVRHPGRVIGLHFFSPAHVMKLLELVIPGGADPRAIATGLALGKRLGKITVPAGVCDGFIGNRIMSAYRLAADEIIAQGTLPWVVDAAMRAFGFPIGVFQMQDLAGLDIAWAMRKRRGTPVPLSDALCETGRFGRKTGQGWYDYRSDPNGVADPWVTALIDKHSGGADRQMPPGQIIQRLLSAMQAEGRAVVATGIAASAEAVDIVMIHGYGFPRWRGGPMYMAREEPE